MRNMQRCYIFVQAGLCFRHEHSLVNPGSDPISPWLPIGHTFCIYPVPGFLLVTRRLLKPKLRSKLGAL
jgi:hypothetical protein